MSNIKITNNHPNNKRKILGPIGRFLLKLVNWDIVGNLPDKQRIIIKKFLTTAILINLIPFKVSYD